MSSSAHFLYLEAIAWPTQKGIIACGPMQALQVGNFGFVQLTM